MAKGNIAETFKQIYWKETESLSFLYACMFPRLHTLLPTGKASYPLSKLRPTHVPWLWQYKERSGNKGSKNWGSTLSVTCKQRLNDGSIKNQLEKPK